MTETIILFILVITLVVATLWPPRYIISYDLAEKGSKDYSVKLTFKTNKNGVIELIKQEII